MACKSTVVQCVVLVLRLRNVCSSPPEFGPVVASSFWFCRQAFFFPILSELFACEIHI